MKPCKRTIVILYHSRHHNKVSPFTYSVFDYLKHVFFKAWELLFCVTLFDEKYLRESEKLKLHGPSKFIWN